MINTRSEISFFSKSNYMPPVPIAVRRPEKWVINRLMNEYNPPEAIQYIKVRPLSKKRSKSVDIKSYSIILTPRMSQYIKFDSEKPT